MVDVCVFLTKVGGDDDLELKIDSIIEGCNDICVRNQGRIYRHLEDQSSPPCFKRKRLTEAVLTMQSPCQARHVSMNYWFSMSNAKSAALLLFID